MQFPLALAKIGAVMFTAAFHTSRHYILLTVMACLCVLLGGPSYAVGADSLFIAGDTYYEPGVSGPGWAWTDDDHLELTGYAGEAIGADGDLVVTLTGQNTVVETSAPDVDISRCGMEVWGDLTPRGTGLLVATGSQCGIYVSGTLAVDGCKVDARADGAGISDARVAGVIAGGLDVRGGGRVVAAGVRAYGVCLLGGAAGGGTAGQLTVDASWLDASGTNGGVACLGGSLASACFVAPAGGAFGAGGVVDADGVTATHVAIEPTGATAPAGETDSRDVPGDGIRESGTGADPTVEQPGATPAAGPAVKPAAIATKTTTTTMTTVKTAASAPSVPKATAAIASLPTLPKTADNNWIVLSSLLFLLGTVFLVTARLC